MWHILAHPSQTILSTGWRLGRCQLASSCSRRTVTALSFKSAIDDPTRFRRSRNVAAYFGLTSRRWQSGTSIDVKGRISKAGDPDVRRALYEAASAMLTRFKGRDTIKTWGLKLAKTKCHAKARVAVARKRLGQGHLRKGGRGPAHRASRDAPAGHRATTMSCPPDEAATGTCASSRR